MLCFVNHVVTWAGMFRQLEPAVLAAVIGRLQCVDYPAGHVIFTEGQPGDRMYIIEFGKVKVSRRSAHGGDNVQVVLGPAQIFGELSVFDPGPRASTATALTDVRLMAMHRCQLREWITGYPEIAEQLLRVLARRVRRTTANQTDLVFMDVTGRLAKQLLQLGQEFGSQENSAVRVTHDLTQEELAQLVGSSRETVNKALTDFARRGWIRLDGAKSLLILNSQALAGRAR